MGFFMKKYPNVLTGAFTASQVRDSLAVPCRGAIMVVQRLRSGANESAAAIAFKVGNLASGTFVSTAGQGFTQRGTAPVTLQQANGQTVALYCGDQTLGAAFLPFFMDFVVASITAPGGGLASTFGLDLEVWYDSDPDMAVLAQVNQSSYTPA